MTINGSPEVPKDWVHREIGKLAHFQNGSAFNEKHWKKSGIPIIRIQNLNGGSDFNHYGGDIERCVIVEPGDLLFSWSGNRGTSFGPFVWTGPRGVLNQHIFRVTPNSAVAKAFLYQALRHVTVEIERQAHGGTGIVHVKKSQLESFSVLVPPFSEQQRIVAILSSVDDAIEVTRALIDHTRHLKTAILQDLLNCGLPGNRSGQSSAEFIPTYPSNWKLETLGQLLRDPIKNGYSPISPQSPTGHWVTTLAAVSEHGYQFAGVKPAPLDNENVISSILVPGDIIVSRSNTRRLVGLAGIYDGHPSPCSYSDLLMRVRVDESKIMNRYMLMWLLSKGSRAYFSRTSRGTSGSMKKIDREILESLPIPLPSLEEQQSIVEISDAMDERVQNELTRLDHLISLKSALSEGLLTGRIPVPTISTDV